MITFSKLGLQGQLGNQLSQYATLYAIAKKNGYRFGVPFDHNSGDNRYCRYAAPDGFRNLTAERCPSAEKEEYLQKFIEPDNAQWIYNPAVMSLPDGIDLEGYFQAEKYFAWCREDLLKQFIFKEKHLRHAREFLARVPKPVVFVHVRRHDGITHATLAKVGNDPGYYKRAAEWFPEAGAFVVLSDDLAWCRSRLSFRGYPHYSPFQDKFDDLALMTLCDGGGIICNSSFSWWGAWLGDQNRKIVAPRNWSEKIPCPDVVPERWIKV